MSGTTHEDQFTQAQDLENECKLARMKSSGLCTWEIHKGGGVNTACRRYFGESLHPLIDEYSTCPFCGKKIEVKK
jgi:hypothetical protein